MINIVSAVVMGLLSLIWKTNNFHNFFIKAVLTTLTFWHIFVALQTFGYILKV